MKLPLFLPKELQFLELKNSAEAFDLLKNQPMDMILSFFVAGSEDQTWMKEGGGEFMGNLMALFSTLPLKEDQLTLILEKARASYGVLGSYLPLDYTFIVAHEKRKIPSLIFLASCDFFKNILSHDKIDKRKERELDTTSSLFDFIFEFVTTGEIVNLWKEEKEVIFSVIEQAAKWGYFELEQYASAILRRYLDRDNLVHYLILAQEKKMTPFKEMICKDLSSHHIGLFFQAKGGNDLEVTVHEVQDGGLEVLERLVLKITHLKCMGSVLTSFELLQQIKKMSYLTYIDFSETTAIDERLYEVLPAFLLHISLRDVSWLDDDALLKIFAVCPHLASVDLSSNNHFTFRAIGELSSLKELRSLNLSYCPFIDDEVADLLCDATPRLAKLSLKGCPLTEEGIVSILEKIEGIQII